MPPTRNTGQSYKHPIGDWQIKLEPNFSECSVSMLEDNRAILPSEAGQPDEDDFATVPLENKVAIIKFPKPSEVTSLQVRATSGLAAEDTALITATFVKLNGETETTVRFFAN